MDNKIFIKRFIGTVIDLLLLFVLSAIVAYLFGDKIYDPEEKTSYQRMNTQCAMIVYPIIFLYAPMMYLLFRKTIGKFIVVTKIHFPIDINNKLRQFLTYFIRNIVAIIENFVLIGLIPIFLLAWKGKRISDIVTGTTVMLNEKTDHPFIK